MGCFLTDKANCGIEKFTPVEAYFLGGILMCSDKHEGSVLTFSVMFNFSQRDDNKQEELGELSELLGKLAEIAGGDAPVEIKGSPSGLAVHFHADEEAAETALGRAKEIVSSGDPDLMRAMLAGAFDSKVTIDTHNSMLAADCPDMHHEEISAIVRELCDKQDISLIEDNPQRHRKGKPRDRQLRMNRKEARKFYANVGLLSPLKLSRALKHFGDGEIIERPREIIPGLKLIEWKSASSQDEGRPTQGSIQPPTSDGPNKLSCPQGGARNNTTRVQPTQGDYERIQNLEGKAVETILKEYQRDPKLRAECLKRKGTRCYVCGFDSAEVYGIQGIVDVHHLKPLSDGGERITDVDRDLVPLCPNCHRAIHSDRNTPYGIKELNALKERLHQSKCE